MDRANEEMTTEIAIIDEATIRDKIYEVRGFKVMIDADLAEIYGYTTSAFNQQVKRNEHKFPEDFRFMLTEDEWQILLSQNVTASWGGDRRTKRWAFTEQGIYMLMTVLNGELATRQSISIIRIFQAMKDYITETQGLVTQRDILRLSMQTNENTEAIHQLQSSVADQQKQLMEHDDKLAQALEQIGETVKKSDIAPILELFDQPEDQQECIC